MKILIPLIAVFAFSTGCDSDKDKAFKVENGLHFFQHEQTGLCFAWVSVEDDNGDNNISGLTVVPCGTQSESCEAK